MNNGQHSKFGLAEAVVGYLFVMVVCLAFLAPGIGFVMLVPVLLFIWAALCKQAPLSEQPRYKKLRKAAGWSALVFHTTGCFFTAHHFEWFEALCGAAVVCVVLFFYFDSKIDPWEHSSCLRSSKRSCQGPPRPRGPNGRFVKAVAGSARPG